MRYKFSAMLAASIGLAVAVSNPASAQQKVDRIDVQDKAIKASEISVETFLRRPEFNQMSLSPNGNMLAAVSPFKGRGNLVVIDLDKRSRQILTSFETIDVAQFYWVNNKRICMRVADGQDVTGRVTYRGTYCINTDGSEFRDFTRIGKRSSTDQGRMIVFEPIRAVGSDSDDYVVAMRERTGGSNDLYRFNTMTGRYELLTFDSPGDVNRWVLDRNQVPRVTVSSLDRKGNETFTREIVWHRDGPSGKWEQLFENRSTWGIPVGDAMYPIAFDYDNTTLYVSSSIGRDKRAIYKYDTKTKKLGELVYEHPMIDLEGGLLFSNEKKKLVGIRLDAEIQKTVWFDPELDALQKQLDATIKGTYNLIGVVEEKSKRLLITSASPTDPGRYFLFDNEKKAIEPLVERRAWLPASAMSERKHITYTARDGMPMNAWVTIPKESSGKNLPLIVHIHGGPQVRAYSGIQWQGRRSESQFFASRGYVVIEPEPRGSTGFGRKHYESSYKQWGLSMQDDLTDAALHLVKQGIVDQNRMCLYGGSYGGYATLQGLVKEPDLWKCGNATVAVTDLFLLQQVQHSDIASRGVDRGGLDTEFTVAVGDSVKDKDQFMLTSPARNTDKIRAPILLSMGSDDARVPLIHAQEFVKAMQKSGKGSNIELVVYNGEGHGFNKDENIHDHWHRSVKFFAKHIGDDNQKRAAGVN